MKKLIGIMLVISQLVLLGFIPTSSAAEVNCASVKENSNNLVNGVYGPLQLARLYGIDKLREQGFDGKGQTVAILSDKKIDLTQLKVWSDCMGLNPDVKQIAVNTNSEAILAIEVIMNVQLVLSLSPAAKIRIYYGPNLTNNLMRIADDNIATIVTSSMAPPCEPSSGQSVFSEWDSAYKALASKKITAVRGSGDMGIYTCHEPRNTVPIDLTKSIVVGAGSIYVTVNGGLTVKQIDPLSVEVWGPSTPGAAGGGGISVFAKRPAYQNAPGMDSTITNRMIPDMAMLADPRTGSLSYAGKNADGSQGYFWQSAGGTSTTGPLLAGVLATTAQYCSKGDPNYRLGWINPALYAMSRDGVGLLDITKGNNTYMGVAGYDATTGYDLASGVGTIDPKSFSKVLCDYVASTERDSYLTVAKPTPTLTPVPVATATPTPSPTLTATTAPTPSATPSKAVVKATTITCIKGKLTKKITAINPKCPTGYKKK
jgi:subtilase family serine protease